MRSHRALLTWLFLIFCLAANTSAQQDTSAIATVVPTLVNFSGTVRDINGKPLTSIVGVTFSLYNASEGGAPLWMETQNVQPDKTGHYSVMLGSQTSQGLPAELFASGEARWLGVRVQGGEELPRVLLLSVPYAMKAADAQTLGGLPASAFMLAAPSTATTAAPNAAAAAPASAPATVSSNVVSDVTTSGGTVNDIPLFTTATNIQNSLLSQTGVAAINVGGKLNLPATGTATAAKGFDSRPQQFVASVFNSSTATAVPQNFLWQAEPVNNDKTTASGTLNLLYATGAAVPAETGLHISNKGLFTFVAGQTFPGTGTVTSVATGAGLTGGPITKTGTISIAAGGVTNADLAHSSIGVLAGSDLTGGSAAIPLGGSTTLNLDTTKVPLLAAANSFKANQSITGNLAVSGTGSFGGNLTAGTVTTVAINTTGVNTFDPGFSDFFGSEPDWVVEVENSGGGNGIISENTASSGTDAGVYASAPNSPDAVGVFGQQGSESGSAGKLTSLHGSTGVGVWGDGGTTSHNIAVAGTVDDGPAAWFLNNSSSGWDTVFIYGQSSAANLFSAFNSATGKACTIDSSADLFCSGTITGVVHLDNGARTVGVSAIQSPKNWFEDAGSAELVNGVAVVTLDHDFAQTVNTEVDYKVFPVPNGDCKGLYVTNKTADSFEVRELGGGTSNVRFDYRIMALRRQYENVRFADQTRNAEHLKQMVTRGPTTPHSHAPNLTRQLHAAPSKAMLTSAATKSQAR